MPNDKVKISVFILLLGLLFLPARAFAQSPDKEAIDSLAAYYQEYFMQLMEEWRMEKMVEFARQWNVNMAGGWELGLNRAFWEERFSLSLSLGLSTARQSQVLIMEYRINPSLLLKGEVSRQLFKSDAWLDLIFKAEY
ncbi:hypothetical protein HY768_01720 [candidate division TA06 bacterium]|uniref:DUF3078 domain-containing protein n=1 Tax=candidate division TA06 bacterium TaxID=2250710 RepID=A0A933I822_UNCT6|nr:hypothetical protein [candidate division TA06 bacterium]